MKKIEIDFVLEQDISLSDKFGKTILPFSNDAMSSISEHLRVDADVASRVFNAVHGKRIDLSGYHDFSKPIKGVMSHLFVLPNDINKRNVWNSPDFEPQQNSSVKWILARCRHFRENQFRVSESVRFLKMISDIVSTGVPLTQIAFFDKEIPGFLVWLRSISAERKIPSNYLIALTYIGVVLLDESEFKETFSDFYFRKISDMMEEYDSSSSQLQKLSRNVLSLELTYLVNIAKEFDLVENAERLFERRWTGWPLEYKGISKPTVAVASEYDLCWRIARGLPFDFYSIWNESSRIEHLKIKYLRGIFLRNIQKARYNKPYRCGIALHTLVEMLCKHSSLTKYEAIQYARGDKSIYRDCRGNFISIFEEDIPFLFMLKKLGLRPYMPSVAETKLIYGNVVREPGFCLEGISYRHAIHYLGENSIYRKDTMVEKIAKWSDSGSSILTIWWDRHLHKARKMTPSVVRKALLDLAKKGVRIAIDVCELMKINQIDD